MIETCRAWIHVRRSGAVRDQEASTKEKYKIGTLLAMGTSRDGSAKKQDIAKQHRTLALIRQGLIPIETLRPCLILTSARR